MEYIEYQSSFRTDDREYHLDISFYPEEGWCSISTGGKKVGFPIESLSEWDAIDNKIRSFFNPIK